MAGIFVILWINSLKHPLKLKFQNHWEGKNWRNWSGGECHLAQLVHAVSEGAVHPNPTHKLRAFVTNIQAEPSNILLSSLELLDPMWKCPSCWNSLMALLITLISSNGAHTRLLCITLLWSHLFGAHYSLCLLAPWPMFQDLLPKTPHLPSFLKVFN